MQRACVGDTELLGGVPVTTTSYAVREVFPTVQGEGFYAGMPAVFVRFAGCNLWSGREETRGRDSYANDAVCPLWCDTTFVPPRMRLDLEALVDLIECCTPTPPLVVFTGGEPLLQLDGPLVAALRSNWIVAVETNGTVAPKPSINMTDLHVVVSPKTSADRIVVRRGQELKVVVPGYAPAMYRDIAPWFEHLWVQPEDHQDNERAAAARRFAVQYALSHPAWRVSAQVHKYLGAE